jgi:hypothetical protein
MCWPVSATALLGCGELSLGLDLLGVRAAYVCLAFGKGGYLIFHVESHWDIW